MADRLGGQCDIDIALEILEYITYHTPRDEIKKQICDTLKLESADLERATGTVRRLRDLIKQQWRGEH